MSEIVFDPELIRRYDKAGPRYTSYPTAVQFHEGFAEREYKDYAIKSNDTGQPLSLYFHLPFCDTVCFYCACNKIVTKNRKRAAPYLQRLYREIAMQAALFDKDRPVTQLHWGGGTPTFISHDEMRELMAETRRYFKLLDDDSGEYSIEVDPREADTDTINLLRELGFNRLSLGVQDFNPAVQKAVNRIQSEAETNEVITAARAAGFHSVSIDLMYGLPLQSVETFTETLNKVIAMSPDRLSVFNYAHLPQMFKTQRQINDDELPTPDVKLAILQLCVKRLTDAGYVYIGMDHFAKPEDELAVAQRNGTLYRNFQGYSTQSECDLIAMGVTSISKVGNSYCQNVKTMEEYEQRIDSGHLPMFRGIGLTADDVLRRHVITQLICHFSLDKAQVEKQFNISFNDYFSVELQELLQLQLDGLVTCTDSSIMVTPAGKFLIRNVCMVFDRYLREAGEKRFSKVI
ncbi:MAG: oxygen-independent coproporphyrinogen III oxidase [Gammaproteobacteria bacterium]|nr:oxygen-independent coproporphyrinogen III oxidase [Gammaproteobacteria bacterium]MDH5652139.1 oxygen-independent coproporphyrinogen III oxidase [Gammaproteobacteria bacterium]